MIAIEKARDNDTDCATCTRSERKNRIGVVYMRVILAPTPDSNRNVVHLCDRCLGKLLLAAADVMTQIAEVGDIEREVTK